MSSDFDTVMQFVLSWEGGYIDDSEDTGGETNFGISERAHPGVSIKDLTIDRAKDIYRRDYWEPIDGDNLPAPVDLAAMDFAVNAGVTLSLNATRIHRSTEPKIWATRLTNDRMGHYLKLAGNDRYRKYLRGWMRRTLAVYRAIGL